RRVIRWAPEVEQLVRAPDGRHRGAADAAIRPELGGHSPAELAREGPGDGARGHEGISHARSAPAARIRTTRAARAAERTGHSMSPPSSRKTSHHDPAPRLPNQSAASNASSN